ncbi:hypothetical protein ABK040_010898 [Willaertia magna]
MSEIKAKPTKRVYFVCSFVFVLSLLSVVNFIDNLILKELVMKAPNLPHERLLKEKHLWNYSQLNDKKFCNQLKQLQKQQNLKTTFKFVKDEIGIPIVFYVCDRPNYFKEALNGLIVTLKHSDKKLGTGMNRKYLLIISMDIIHKEMVDVILQFKKQTKHFITTIILFHENRIENEPRGYNRLKRHWWFLMESLFENLCQLQQINYDKEFVFLEEDHLILSDWEPVLYHLIGLKNTVCEDCFGASLSGNGLSLIANPHPYHMSIIRIGNEITINPNAGYSFNSTMWNLFKKTVGERWFIVNFNNHWDNSLGYFMYLRVIPSLYMLPMMTRVLHIGKEGGLTVSGEDEGYYTTSHKTIDPLLFDEKETAIGWQGNEKLTINLSDLREEDKVILKKQICNEKCRWCHVDKTFALKRKQMWCPDIQYSQPGKT